MQRTSYQEGDSEEVSTLENVMNTRRNKTLSLHLIFRESKMKMTQSEVCIQKIGAAIWIKFTPLTIRQALRILAKLF